MFRSQTPLRKSFATRTAPSPNFARSIAYPLLEARRRSRFFMTIARPLDKGWFAPLAGAPSSHIIKPQVADRFPLLALQRVHVHGSSAGYGVRSSRCGYCPRRAPSFRCPPLRSREGGGIRRRRAPGVAAGAPGRLLPSYRPHFGGEVRDAKTPSRSGYGAILVGYAASPLRRSASCSENRPELPHRKLRRASEEPLAPRSEGAAVSLPRLRLGAHDLRRALWGRVE